MRMVCVYENNVTGEKRKHISALDAREVKTVTAVRAADGDEAAHVVASAMALRSAYRELDPNEWSHLAAPEFVIMN